MIGSQDVARAPADGHTLLFNASSQVYMPLVVNRKTYDAEKDFTAIAQVGYVPLAVVGVRRRRSRHCASSPRTRGRIRKS